MLDFLFYSILSGIGAVLWVAWIEFSGEKFARLEFVPSNKIEIKLKCTRQSMNNSISFLFSASILGFFVGVFVQLYIKGFIFETGLNFYAISFIQLLSGFLMPSVLYYFDIKLMDSILK